MRCWFFRLVLLFGAGLICNYIIAPRTAQAQQATQAPEFSDSYMMREPFLLHTGVYTPKQFSEKEIKADIVFLHGYGDRFINHLPLFKKWNEAGFRVISYDYPNHGRTVGKIWGDLSFVSIAQLGEIAAQLEKNSANLRIQRPLFLAGWSLGGLVVSRILQTNLKAKFSRPIAGFILYAPAVAPRPCPGGQYCRITNATLTHDTNLQSRDISPDMPWLRPSFAGLLYWQARESWFSFFPKNIPGLMFVAGDQEDTYVFSHELRNWGEVQRAQGASLQTLTCATSKHELDNESEKFAGVEVRLASVQFFTKVLEKKSENFHVEQSTQALCK